MNGDGFQRVFSGAPWEADVGYCRAVRAGDHVYVTGTAPVAEDGGGGSMEVLQERQLL